MSNGCICCTLRDDLLQEVRRLAEEGRFDALLIESTGVSEPMPIAATFDFTSEDGDSLNDVALIDAMVTVVDAHNLFADFGSTDFLAGRGQSAGEDDNRRLVSLLTDQIEFANVIVVNKTDLVDAVRLQGPCGHQGIEPESARRRSCAGREIAFTHFQHPSLQLAGSLRYAGLGVPNAMYAEDAARGVQQVLLGQFSEVSARVRHL